MNDRQKYCYKLFVFQKIVLLVGNVPENGIFARKLYEGMIRKKLTGAIDQYGFRKRRFTVQAMAEAIRLVASNCDNKWLVLTLLHVIRETCQKGKNNRQ